MIGELGGNMIKENSREALQSLLKNEWRWSCDRGRCRPSTGSSSQDLATIRARATPSSLQRPSRTSDLGQMQGYATGAVDTHVPVSPELCRAKVGSCRSSPQPKGAKAVPSAAGAKGLPKYGRARIVGDAHGGKRGALPGLVDEMPKTLGPNSIWKAVSLQSIPVGERIVG